MFKIIGFSALLGFSNLNSLAQTEPKFQADSIKYNDIYSNFNRDQYTPSKNFKMYISKNGDTIRVLSNEYPATIANAERLFKKSDFAGAAELYSSAFKNNHNLGKVEDRYKAACCYAMLNNFDSAFYQLDRIVTTGKYYQNEEIENEKLLKPLHKDKRWPIIIAMVIKNKTDLKNQLDAATEQ